MTSNITQSTTKNLRKKGRIRALFVGGLIVAVGIGGTLASWNSSVMGEGKIFGKSTPSDGELQIRDKNNNFVSNSGKPETATHFADIFLDKNMYPSSENNVLVPRQEWVETRLKLKGIGEEKFLLNMDKPSVAGDKYEGNTKFEGFAFPPRANLTTPCYEKNLDTVGLANYRFSYTGSAHDREFPELEYKGDTEIKICTKVINDFDGDIFSTDKGSMFMTFKAKPKE